LDQKIDEYSSVSSEQLEQEDQQIIKKSDSKVENITSSQNSLSETNKINKKD